MHRTFDNEGEGVKPWCIKRIIFIANPAAIMIIFSLLLASQRDRGGVSKSPALASNPQSIVVKHVCQNNRSFLHCKKIWLTIG